MCVNVISIEAAIFLNWGSEYTYCDVEASQKST